MLILVATGLSLELGASGVMANSVVNPDEKMTLWQTRLT